MLLVLIFLIGEICVAVLTSRREPLASVVLVNRRSDREPLASVICDQPSDNETEMAGRSSDGEMLSTPVRRIMVDATHSAGAGNWCELPDILIQEFQGTTYLEVPREFLYEFANLVRLPEGYDESWACQRDWHADCDDSSDAGYGQTYQ